MIKINVITNNISWQSYIKNPNSFIEKKIKNFNKKYKDYKKKNIFCTLLLSGNNEIKKLNKKFRKKDKTTDVLSFPMKIKEKKKIYVGDIAISYEIIKERSKKTNFFFEFDKMWIHGYLHLIGHDHKKLNDFKKMFKKEKLILNYFHKVN